MDYAKKSTAKPPKITLYIVIKLRIKEVKSIALHIIFFAT